MTNNITFNSELEIFYKQKHNKLISVIKYKTKCSEEDAEDLAHVIYESCIKYAKTCFHKADSMYTYIFNTAQKFMAKFLRTNGNYWSEAVLRDRRHFSGKNQELEYYKEAEQEIILNNKSTTKQVQKFVQTLPKRQKEIALGLMYKESYKELMDVLGITKTNITSTWQIILDKGKSFFNREAINFNVDNNLIKYYKVIDYGHI